MFVYVFVCAILGLDIFTCVSLFDCVVGIAFFWLSLFMLRFVACVCVVCMRSVSVWCSFVCFGYACPCTLTDVVFVLCMHPLVYCMCAFVAYRVRAHRWWFVLLEKANRRVAVGRGCGCGIVVCSGGAWAMRCCKFRSWSGIRYYSPQVRCM